MATKKELPDDVHSWNIALRGPGYTLKLEVETETEKISEVLERAFPHVFVNEPEVQDEPEAPAPVRQVR